MRVKSHKILKLMMSTLFFGFITVIKHSYEGLPSLQARHILNIEGKLRAFHHSMEYLLEFWQKVNLFLIENNTYTFRTTIFELAG